MYKVYIPKDIEKKIYFFWNNNGFFKPKQDVKKKNFCIVMPPPNITGDLHMGHAFQHTIMDILIRYNRMKGKNTLWQVGIDHAGIATQMIVEKKVLHKNYKNLKRYGINKFIKKIWKWKRKSQKNIFNQMCSLGDSVYWNNTRFTLDKRYSISVKKVFIKLYKDNLIYKRKKISNFDIKLKTVISDLEVKKKKILSKMWYINYPLLSFLNNFQKKRQYITIATTRPETIFGDTAIIVNPKDKYNKYLIGDFAVVPLVNRVIPIIGDDFSDLNKGSGCVKITPGHDFNDYLIGMKYKLPMISFINLNGTVRKSAKVYDCNGILTNVYNSFIPKRFHFLKYKILRKIVIIEIIKLNLFKKVDECFTNILYGDRSNGIVEPMLTSQWYLRVNLLSKNAINIVKSGKISFISKKYKNMYFSWLKNVNDWCISRQLWWGHRIPVWYDKKKNIFVGKNEKEVRIKYNISKKIKLIREKDVLDTWFSSSLWSFSSLGWPKKTKFFKMFHSTNVLISGFDIIFFWIARMIMITTYILKDSNNISQIPFRKVYITGLIRDDEGNKMSKSKGNVIDPLDIINGISLKSLIKKRTKNLNCSEDFKKIYKNTKKSFPNGIEPMGADAIRLAFTKLSSSNRYINWDINVLHSCRSFCTKLWNASYFILTNYEQKKNILNKKYELSILDHWICIKYNKTIKKFKKYLYLYRFDLLVNILYKFFRIFFCDWYLELSKKIINAIHEFSKYNILYVMLLILESFLRLIHPIIPFITEYIWKKIIISLKISKRTIMLEKFPKFFELYRNQIFNKEIYKNMNFFKKIIIVLRKIRMHININKYFLILIFLKIKNIKIVKFIKKNYFFLIKIANLKCIEILKVDDLIPMSIIQVIDKVQLFVPILGIINKTSELQRLNLIIKKIIIEIFNFKKKLNINFIKFAPKKIVIKQKKKLLQFKKELREILKQKKIILKF